LQAITGGYYMFAWGMEGWSEEQISEARRMFTDILKRLDPENKLKPDYEEQ